MCFRNTAPHPLTFLKLSVTINTSEYSSEFAVNNETHKNPTLEFHSKEVKRFLIEFMPEPSDINKDIQVKCTHS